MDIEIKKRNIISSSIYVIIMLLILIFFAGYLPNYTLYVYTIITVIVILSSSLMLSIKGLYIHKIIYLLSFLSPIIFLQYTHIKYHDVIQQEKSHLTLYNRILSITTLLLIIQIILFNYGYLQKNKTYLYSTLLLSLFNTFLSGLLWRDVAFFITDG